MEKTPLTNQQPNKPTGKHHRRVYDKAEKVIGDLNGWTAFVEVRKENEEEGFRIASEYRQDLIARFDFARLSRKKKMDSTFINYFVNPIQLALRL